MNILLVTETQGYLMMSLQEKLKIKDYQTLVVPADINAISRVQLPLNAILIYMDEKLLAKQNVLVYLRDKAIEDDLPVFLIGDNNEIALVQKLFPSNVAVQSFSRPLNLIAVSEALDNYLRENGENHKKKILVVDDSGAMLRNVKSWLGSRYDVILANSGAMAIKYLGMSRPDLVLLDYEMPVCDGKQVLEMIRTETEFVDIPVFFLTSKGDRESVMNVMALKPEGYLLKTMEPVQIVAAVDEFFAKKKSRML